eukprot:NODE_3104_length_2092_cov_3.340458.p1 GENE.NODE_3104_length_2092_cov_3.340458~~NODE_3104_length_2092_cov_3.340458.p1  ORF type:complete len:571 (-),score=149.72 NODE_3104_length_2092_cov_3.340458:319-2031(-)
MASMALPRGHCLLALFLGLASDVSATATRRTQLVELEADGHFVGADNFEMQPHLVFVLLDDLGYADFWQSADLNKAWPNVKKLASSECLAVENYYAMPTCTPARGAFMSGRYPIRIGLQHKNIVDAAAFGLPLDEVTLAEKLRNVGYNTAGVGKWHLGHYSYSSIPTRRGFESWYGFLVGGLDYLDYTFNMEDTRVFGVYDNEVPAKDVKSNYSTHLWGDAVDRRLREHAGDRKGQPLFLYYAMQNVHSPVETLTEYSNNAACEDIEGKDRKTYCGMALAADEAIGRLMQGLEETLPGEDVIVVISGDNGGDYTSGGVNCASLDDPMCLRGRKGEFWEGGIRNHALVCSKTLVPEKRKGETYTKGLVTIADWHTTLLELAGATDQPSFGPLDGVSVWDALMGDLASPRTEFLINIDPCRVTPTASSCLAQTSAYRYNGCVNTTAGTDACGDWKLTTELSAHWCAWPANGSDTPDKVICATETKKPNKDLVTRLHNISGDPTESNDLLAKYPEVVALITAKIDALAEEMIDACNVPDGTCTTNDERSVVAARRDNFLFPWVTDEEARLEGR